MIHYPRFRESRIEECICGSDWPCDGYLNMAWQYVRRTLERNAFGRQGGTALPTAGIEVREHTLDPKLLTERVVTATQYFRLTSMYTVEGRSYPPGLDGLATFTNISL